MKFKLTISMMLLIAASLHAQRPDFSERCKEEMKKLAFLVGDWEGEAKVKDQSGVLTISQTEHIEWKLNDLVLSIEGVGKQNNEITFHAMAMVNFNPALQQYQLRSYLKEGYSTDAYFKVIAENKFEWGFDIPSGGKSKYVITLDPGKRSWNEIGEYSRDGNTWMQFIELNLTKK